MEDARFAERRKQTFWREQWRVIVALLLIAVYVAAAIRLDWWHGRIFWDSDVYARAVADLAAGRDPYHAPPPPFLPFVYHPLVLRAIAALYLLAPQWPWCAMLILASAGWAWRETRLLSAELGIAPAGLEAVLVASTIGFAGVKGAATGNITVALHFSLIAALLLDLRKQGLYFGRTALAVTVLAALVKPPFLAYALIRFLNRERPFAEPVQVVAITGLLAAALWLSGLVLFPGEMAGYLHNVTQLNAEDHLDVGFGLYGLFRKVMPTIPALALHAAIAGGICIFVLARMRENTRDRSLLLAVLGAAYLVVSITNPRLKGYDVGPALIGFAATTWTSWSRPKLVLTLAMVAMIVPTALNLFQMLRAG